MRFSILPSLAALLSVSAAHPGHDLSEEIAERQAFKAVSRRSDLSHCASKLKARGVQRRNVLRRAAMANALKKRTLEDDLATDHNQTSSGYTTSTPASTLFAGENSCLLTPEVTDGPYYVSGEYVRRDIVEDQTGVPLTLDYQVVDVDTCEPVPSVYLEIWHCNATGVYSGVENQAGLDTTFLRGIQETDADGVAQFESIFPGHYSGRATHIHVLVHANATLLSNSTLGHDTTASHVGQAFFDQDLISQVEAVSPYTSNEQQLTENSADDILAEEAATDGVDPLMEYSLLGSDVSDGIFAWMAFGMNTTYAASAAAAAILYEDGGVTNPDGPPSTPPNGL
ncbi:Intradiol ring-cleavage dioxygenase [Xylariaceae sp. FL0016]|nr:Intradiol ring-cleavage dioxygenase [Xylariaceae sp. FL0016]